MENVSNISSEEELMELRNEGKISEDEYEELLETLRKSAKARVGSIAQAQAEPVRTSGLAIASLVLALALGPLGFVPAVICGHLALRRIENDMSLRGRGLAIAGLIIGYSIFGLTIVLSIPVLIPVLMAYRSAALTPLETELKRFPLVNAEGVITKGGIQIDKQITSDGNGSLRIETMEPTTIRIFETGDIDVENTRLIYEAKVRTENVEGQVYLEMWCCFPGRGEFFSRDLMTPLTGSTDWTTEETPFFLKKGQNPDNVKLNLVINGKGTVWIDDIRLLTGPLK